jgi:hypothetical protein
LIREANNEKTKKLRRRNDKRHWIDEQVKKAEEAATIGNLKELYDTTRVPSRKKFTRNKSVTGTDGNLITCTEEQMKSWTEHFEKILNRDVEEDEQQAQNENQEEETGIKGTEENTGQGTRSMKISTDTPTLEEVKTVIKQLKNGKAPGIDNIPPDILTAYVDKAAKLLHPLMIQVRQEEKYPNDWNKGQ